MTRACLLIGICVPLGLALGMHLSGMSSASVESGERTDLVGMGVDDSPAAFYEKINRLLREMGVADQP